jgi:hypothetical protein
VHDLADINPYLATDDDVSQADVGAAIVLNSARFHSEQDHYEARPLKAVTLSQLRLQYEQNNVPQAMDQLLRRRTVIEVKDDDLFLQSNPQTIWNCNADRRLDYICTMGDRLGLHAALTNNVVHLSYEFELAPRPEMLFGGRYAQLGADQKGALLRIGSRPEEEVYIFMCPKDVLEGSQETLPEPGLATGRTCMKKRHSRILIAFLAYCLSQMRDSVNVYCREPYRIQLNGDMNWSFTNAL